MWSAKTIPVNYVILVKFILSGFCQEKKSGFTYLYNENNDDPPPIGVVILLGLLGKMKILFKYKGYNQKGLTDWWQNLLLPDLGSGSTAVGFDGDVRKQEDAARVIAATVEHFGKLDILVNGAAGNFLASPEDLKPKGFRTVLDIDTVGTYTMCYEALKYLKKGGPGRGPSSGGLIINISATLQYTAAWYQIHVSAAKAGVDGITRSLALEWGTDYDIRVNGIAPGPIQDTPGMRKLAPEEMGNKGKRETMPLFKLGEKWDIAMAALYLASDA
ncbi:hypothetical protein ACJX0J_041229, partial [Zea mays]